MDTFKVIRVYTEDAEALEEIRKVLVMNDGVNRPLAAALRAVMAVTEPPAKWRRYRRFSTIPAPDADEPATEA
jgi:hypothetical protein